MARQEDDNNFNYLRRNSLTTPRLVTPYNNHGFKSEMYLPNATYFNSATEKRRCDKEIDDHKINEPNKEEKETIPKLIRHFLGYTTAHGFSRLGDSKGLFWKVFWSLVCLASFVMFAIQAHGLFKLYFSRPVSTTVRITFEKTVPFPAVTICNLNMLRNDKVPQFLKQELAKEYDHYNASQDLSQARQRRDLPSTGSPPTDSGSASADTDPVNTRAETTSADTLPLTTFAEITSADTLPLTTFAKTTTSSETTSSFSHTTSSSYSGTTRSNSYYPTYNRYGTTHSSYYNRDYYYNSQNNPYQDKEYLPKKDEVDGNTLFLEKFTTLVTRVPEEQLRMGGHQFEDFIINCTWRGYECKTGNYSKWWYQSWNYKYGNCFTFNGGKEQNNEPLRILSTSKPGPNQGLLLRINVEQERYLESISEEAGVRVILHDQGVMPFPFQEGFSVAPGMATSVGIQKTVISRVDRFNNNTCWDLDELDEDNIYRIFYNITKYTQQTCQNSCLGQTQFEECGCSEYTYPSSSPACDAFNDTVRKCLWNVHFQFNNDKLRCVEECRQPCREDVIQKTISMSQWPSDRFKKLKSKGRVNFTSSDNLLLNIFYNELNYQRIEESVFYDEINLLADIGGQLGLWIGVSVITCIEVFEIFVLITMNLLRKFRKKDRAEEDATP